MRSGVPTPSITRATNECTGAISTATWGASAKPIPATREIVEERAKVFLDIFSLA